MRARNRATLAIVGLSLSMIAAPAFSEEKREQTAVSTPVRALEVRADRASVVVQRGAQTVVEVVKHYRVREPEVSVRVEDGVLRISSRCERSTSTWWPSWVTSNRNACSTDIRVTLARRNQSVPADVLTSGAVSLTGVNGTHKLHSQGGRVNVQDVRGHKMTTQSSGGPVRLERLVVDEVLSSTSGGSFAATAVRAKTYSVSTSGGSLVLDMQAAPQTVSGSSSGGSMTVTLPAGRYRLDASTSGGRMTIDNITPDAKAQRHLRLSSSGGSITVRGR